MMDQPDAHELLGAVRLFIEQTAMPALKGHAAFHARVAANVLAILEREMRQWPQAEAEARARLVEIIGQDGELSTLTQALCRAIRSGALSIEDARVIAHLRAVTIAKVRIDQPNYSGLAEALTQR